MKRTARKAFTLIEVNVAILILSAGVLALITLFAFGFRENRQSREDVGSAALADAVLSRIVMAASATNLKWSAFRREFCYPPNAWEAYVDDISGVVTMGPAALEDMAEGAFASTMSWLDPDGTLEAPTAFPQGALDGTGMKCGLVVQHEEDSAVVKITFRATRHPGELLAMPVFYTEVRFQGLPDR